MHMLRSILDSVERVGGLRNVEDCCGLIELDCSIGLLACWALSFWGRWVVDGNEQSRSASSK